MGGERRLLNAAHIASRANTSASRRRRTLPSPSPRALVKSVVFARETGPPMTLAAMLDDAAARSPHAVAIHTSAGSLS
jgi:hypothetical protein